ncbi:MAG: insulinase family protein [Clostridiales bacterium]|nr:insulinase family protein [Clostridiales bacterium]
MKSGGDHLKEQAVKIESFKGTDIFWIKTDKFKTNSINIFFLDNLNREHASKNALLPAVLKRGTSGYPTYGDIARRLEELYGASFDCETSKKGEAQIIQFYTEFLSDKYAGSDTDLFGKSLELLMEVICRPYLSNGCFHREYVDLEKDNLKKLIANKVNDKMQYSLDRCFEEMCAGEPFEISEHGVAGDIDGITPEDLFEHYGRVLSEYPCKVFVSGNIDLMDIDKLNKAIFSFRTKEASGTVKNLLKYEVSDVREVTERMNVSQGKLSLGFRTGISADSPDYCALMVCNSILGSGMHSKLFQNVREKAGLAYYAFSRLEKYKGLMIVSSGIESENKDKAKDIILEQLEDIRNGIISDHEFEATLKTIETGLNSLRDSQMQIVEFNLGQQLGGTDDSFETLTEKVKRVTREDVSRVAKGIRLDTIYFLTSEEVGA